MAWVEEGFEKAKRHARNTATPRRAAKQRRCGIVGSNSNLEERFLFIKPNGSQSGRTLTVLQKKKIACTVEDRALCRLETLLYDPKSHQTFSQPICPLFPSTSRANDAYACAPPGRSLPELPQAC